MDVRVIPTKTHALLDYGAGPVLAAVPTALRLEPTSVSSLAPRVAAVGGAAMSALSNHELAARRLIPMRAHLLADGAVGVGLAAAPWISGSARGGLRYWLPHALVGAGDVALALTTRVRPRSRMERLRGMFAFVPRRAAVTLPVVAVLAVAAVAARKRSGSTREEQPTDEPVAPAAQEGADEVGVQVVEE